MYNNEEANKNEIVDSFGESMLNSSLDMFSDWGESSIDLLFDDDIIRNIPIIKSIYAVGKVAICLRDKFFCQRTLAFLQEFTNDQISKEALEKHIEKLNDEKRLKKEYETVIQYLDLCTKDKQAQLLARFYLGFLKGEISEEVFDELADVNRRMLLCDYDMIKKIVLLHNYTGVSEDEEPMVSRLVSLGLAIDYRLHATVMVTEDYEDEGVILSALGKVFGNYLEVSRGDMKYNLERKSRYDRP